MVITICGSMVFAKEMLEAEEKLKSLGHEVYLPLNKLQDNQGNNISVEDYYKLRKSELPPEWVWDRKKWVILEHFKKIERSEAVLVLNYEKNAIPGYIGANTLIEMGLALYLNKGIYLYNEIPEISYKEEILGMKPILINQDLDLIISK